MHFDLENVHQSIVLIFALACLVSALTPLIGLFLDRSVADDDDRHICHVEHHDDHYDDDDHDDADVADDAAPPNG